jgi:hypothetical protein
VAAATEDTPICGLDRVFYGSDYVGEDPDEHVALLQAELDHVQNQLGSDMARLGYPPLADSELEGLLATNVRRCGARYSLADEGTHAAGTRGTRAGPQVRGAEQAHQAGLFPSLKQPLRSEASASGKS